MKRLIPALALGLGSCIAAQAQLYIDNATFFIETGATVTVQGDLTSNVSIQGPGKILLKGSVLQNVNMNNGGAVTNAYAIPNLEIDNAANVNLTGNAKVATNLTFTNGKILAGNFNFVLANGATVTTPGASKFIETNGTGFAQRELTAASSNLLLPVGVGTSYTPISLSHASGTYGATSLVGAQAKLARSPNSHIRTESHTNAYWPVASTNITGGTLTGIGTYNDPGFTGIESEIRGMSFNGTEWTLTGGNQDVALNTVTGSLTGVTSGQVFGMNRFLLMNSKALLQGANPVAGVMSEALRVAPTVLPTTEPYRSAPYSFTTYNGGTQEVAAAAVFNDLGNNNNIVDWVFVELRAGATSGTAIPLQTRSALIQRDGDIVDMDGASPLYFKNENSGDYTITVRHRNHLPISTNNTASFFKNLTLSGSTSSLDFTTLAAGNVLGTANTNYLNSGGFNIMYAGNANFNSNIRYAGIANDKDYLLSAVLGSNQGLILSNVYNQGDLNMNKTVRYSGISNDKDFLLSTPLSSNQATIKLQIIPN